MRLRECKWKFSQVFQLKASKSIRKSRAINFHEFSIHSTSKWQKMNRFVNKRILRFELMINACYKMTQLALMPLLNRIDIHIQIHNQNQIINIWLKRLICKIKLSLEWFPIHLYCKRTETRGWAGSSSISALDKKMLNLVSLLLVLMYYPLKVCFTLLLYVSTA